MTFRLHVGHLFWAAMADLMHALQKMWPHLVDISSTNGPMQTGQLKVGSFGGGGSGSGCDTTEFTLSLCSSEKIIKLGKITSYGDPTKKTKSDYKVDEYRENNQTWKKCFIQQSN